LINVHIKKKNIDSNSSKIGLRFTTSFFSIFSLAAILVGSRDHRTQIWKGAIQGPFHQSLVAIGPVVSEEKIFWKSTNQKQELSVVDMLVNGSELNEQSL
jgi:hypothetical protein